RPCRRHRDAQGTSTRDGRAGQCAAPRLGMTRVIFRVINRPLREGPWARAPPDSRTSSDLLRRRKARSLARMCDNDSFDDMVAYRLRQELLSRRTLGSLTLGAGLASLLPLGCAPAEPATSPTPAASGSAAASTGTPANAAATTTESEVSLT